MSMISIIVPVYNVEQYLHKCIDSILAQTFTDFELILVDDGSPDNCGKICDEYAKKDDRIKVIHKKNGGLSDARNAGLDIAKGEYIGFVDSDDYIESEMYENLLKAMEKGNADMAVCAYSAVDEVGNIIFTWPLLEEDIYYDINDFLKDYYNKNFPMITASACNKLYRKEVFNTLRYPVKKLHEDSFVILDVLNQCKKLVHVKNSYYNYFTSRAGSIMNSPFTQRNFDLIELAYKNYKFFERSNFPTQKGYALLDYCNKYMKVYLATRILYKNFRRLLKPYITQYRSLTSEIKKCDEICNLKKVTLAILPILPRTALKICRKYFPESLYDFMK